MDRLAGAEGMRRAHHQWQRSTTTLPPPRGPGRANAAIDAIASTAHVRHRHRRRARSFAIVLVSTTATFSLAPPHLLRTPAPRRGPALVALAIRCGWRPSTVASNTNTSPSPATQHEHPCRVAGSANPQPSSQQHDSPVVSTRTKIPRDHPQNKLPRHPRPRKRQADTCAPVPRRREQAA